MSKKKKCFENSFSTINRHLRTQLCRFSSLYRFFFLLSTLITTNPCFFFAFNYTRTTCPYIVLEILHDNVNFLQQACSTLHNRYSLNRHQKWVNDFLLISFIKPDFCFQFAVFLHCFLQFQKSRFWVFSFYFNMQITVLIKVGVLQV